MNLINKIKLDINKFSFSQLTSNSDGKTSGSGTMGVLICTVGALIFVYSSFTKQTETINQAVIMTGIGAGLLGYRKSKDSLINNSLSETSQNASEIVSETSQTKTEIDTQGVPKDTTDPVL